jgi:hypothetical protein
MPTSAQERFGPGRVLEQTLLPVGPPMDKAIVYAISAFIFIFGVGILVAGLSSSSPVIWICVAIIFIAIGIVSAFGPI